MGKFYQGFAVGASFNRAEHIRRLALRLKPDGNWLLASGKAIHRANAKTIGQLWQKVRSQPRRTFRPFAGAADKDEVIRRAGHGAPRLRASLDRMYSVCRYTSRVPSSLLPRRPVLGWSKQNEGRSPDLRISAMLTFPALLDQWYFSVAHRLQLRGQSRNSRNRGTVFPFHPVTLGAWEPSCSHKCVTPGGKSMRM